MDADRSLDEELDEKPETTKSLEFAAGIFQFSKGGNDTGRFGGR